MKNITPLNKLGNRICILGCSGSGKSTLARALSIKLNIPPCHLDMLAHIPNTKWIAKSHEEFLAAYKKEIQKDSWIIDGNYRSHVDFPERLSLATSAIWLDFNVYANIYRYIKRSLKNDPSRPGRLQGAKSEFSWKMISYIWSQGKKPYHLMPSQYPHLVFVHITSMRELKEYYKYWRLSF